MARVEFHILTQAGDDARLKYACQRVEQAQQHAQQVFVRFGSDTELRRFDELLWTFRDQAFIPHELAGATAPSHPRIVALLGRDEAVPESFRTLINLGNSLPGSLQNIECVIEVVDNEPARKQQARERYKLYREQGSPVETINVA